MGVKIRKIFKNLAVIILFLLASMAFSAVMIFVALIFPPELPGGNLISYIGDKIMIRYFVEDDIITSILANDIKRRMDGWDKVNIYENAETGSATKAIEQEPERFEAPKKFKPEKIAYRTDASRKAMEPKDIYREYGSSIVQIIVQGPDKSISYGSGFVISENGAIATNYHVIQPSDEEINISDIDFRLAVSFPDSGLVYPASSLLFADKCNDLAIIKINPGGKKIKSVPLGDSDQLEPGDMITSIGHPRNYTNSILEGMVSSLRTHDCPKKLVQLSIRSEKGHSGGPIFNSLGEAVALYNATASDSFGSPISSIGFAVPINLVKDLLAEK